MKRRTKRSQCWSHTEGARGFTVTVQERSPGGLIYARAYDPKLRGGRGGYRRISLKHSDRELARKYALKQAGLLREGIAEITEERVTLARIFALYVKFKTPMKVLSGRRADERRSEMWVRVLGASKHPAVISEAEEWQPFIDRRRSGEIDARGRVVEPAKRVPVRDRVIEADCVWLRSVLTWAVRYRSSDGKRLLKENGTDGREMPSELNPRRPIATMDRYEATRAVSDSISMDTWWDGKRRAQRSYLSEILDIVNGSARRISAVCNLRFQDLKLERSPKAPHGAIRWPGATDKEGKEWFAPISGQVRTALDRIVEERPGIAGGYLFPSAANPSAPITKDLAGQWLVRAEQLAGLPKLDGGLWHPYRRKWATERKTLPIADVAQAGGWRSIKTLEDCYQQADEDTMLSVVLGGFELREQRG